MSQWVLYGKSGNPSSDIAKAWFKNNGIPVDEKSIFEITRDEIERIARLVPGGIKNMVYPDTFSFSLINPQKKTEKVYIDEIQHGELLKEEIVNILANHPSLIITPIVTNYNIALIGYDLDTIVSTFRFVKVKDVTMA